MSNDNVSNDNAIKAYKSFPIARFYTNQCFVRSVDGRCPSLKLVQSTSDDRDRIGSCFRKSDRSSKPNACPAAESSGLLGEMYGYGFVCQVLVKDTRSGKSGILCVIWLDGCSRYLCWIVGVKNLW